MYQVVDRFSAPVRKMAQAAERLESRLVQTQRKLSSIADKTSSFGRDLAPVSAAISAMGYFSLKAAAQMESLEIAFSVLLGNAEKAKGLLKDLKQYADITPFSLDQVMQGAKVLLAFNIPAEELNNTIRMLGDVAAGTNTDLGNLARVYGQIQSLGRLQGNDAMQLTGMGVSIISELKKMPEFMGKTTQQIQKMQEKGQLSAKLVTRAFENMTSEGGRFFGMTEKMGNSLSGRFSTLTGNLWSASAAFGEAINDAYNLKENIGKLAITIDQLTNKFNNLSPKTKNFIVYALTAGAALSVLLLAFAALVKTIAVLAGIFAVIVSPIGLITAAIIATGAAVYALTNNFSQLMATISNFLVPSWLKDLLGLANGNSAIDQMINGGAVMSNMTSFNGQLDVNVKAPTGTSAAMRSGGNANFKTGVNMLTNSMAFGG